MTEQMQEAKATRLPRKAKAKSHPSNTIQTSSEIISVDEPENALPEVSLADLPQLLQTACAKARVEQPYARAVPRSPLSARREGSHGPVPYGQR